LPGPGYPVSKSENVANQDQDSLAVAEASIWTLNVLRQNWRTGEEWCLLNFGYKRVHFREHINQQNYRHVNTVTHTTMFLLQLVLRRL